MRLRRGKTTVMDAPTAGQRHSDVRMFAQRIGRAADNEIVAGLRERDAHALEQLAAEYGSLIAHWASTEGSEAEDVVQDVLFRVWRAGHRLDPETSLPGWLKAVTQNTIRNRWRASLRKPVVPSGLEVGRTGTVDPIARQTDRIAMEQALDTLSPREREVLKLLYISDLPMEEVAQRLDASREAIKSLAARARRRFRGQVEDLLGITPPTDREAADHEVEPASELSIEAAVDLSIEAAGEAETRLDSTLSVA